jgi:hypothetical protein
MDRTTAALEALDQFHTTIKAADSEGRPRKQSDVLTDLGRRHVLFQSPDRTAFARVDHAIYQIDSAAYREVLAAEFFELTGRGANRNSIGDAIVTLAAMARARGETHRVFLRTAETDDGIVIDPCHADRRVIEIRATGWNWSMSTTAMLRRTPGMQALPIPRNDDHDDQIPTLHIPRGDDGDVRDVQIPTLHIPRSDDHDDHDVQIPTLHRRGFARLWDFISIQPEHRVLVAAWILQALRPSGPFPILNLSGEQGSGKTTFTRVLRSLTDPSASPVRAPPKDTRDLLVGALNGWVLALDNLSYLSAQMSDALCRISTGGAISERALYSNTDEVLVEVQRPIVINGIEELANRPDLAQRCINIELPVRERNLPEATFWLEFNNAKPDIFADILDALALAVRDHRTVRMGRLPRMADFAMWAAAGLPALGFTVEEFIAAYAMNQNRGIGRAIDSSPAGRAVVELVRTRGGFDGTAAELLANITPYADDRAMRSKNWPQTPNAMASVIRRLAPALRVAGVSVEHERTETARLIRLCNAGKPSSGMSGTSSAPSWCCPP